MPFRFQTQTVTAGIIPKSLAIRIPIYEDGEPIDLPLTFRYRLSNKKLEFSVRFMRMADMVSKATRSKIEALALQVGVPLIYGALR